MVKHNSGQKWYRRKNNPLAETVFHTTDSHGVLCRFGVELDLETESSDPEHKCKECLKVLKEIEQDECWIHNETTEGVLVRFPDGIARRLPEMVLPDPSRKQCPNDKCNSAWLPDKLVNENLKCPSCGMEWIPLETE